jgi:hypothetical protein
VVAVSDILDGVSAEELRRRRAELPDPSGPREFRCPECSRRCTFGTDGTTELGHRPGCPRRDRRPGGLPDPRFQTALTDGGQEEGR